MPDSSLPDTLAFTRPARKSALIYSALAAVVISAAVLRFLHLDQKSFWIDESVSVAIARLDWWNFLRLLWRREANMAFYYLLLRGWLHLGGSEYFIRALSAMFAVATIPAVYRLGAKLFGTGAGLAAAALLACNAFHVRFAQEARSYALGVLLVVLSSIFFVDCLRAPSPRNRAAYVITSALAVYSHFFALLVLGVQFVSLMFLPPDMRREQLARSARWIAWLVLPLLAFIAATGAGPIAWIPRPSLASLEQFALILSGNGRWPLVALYLLPMAIALWEAWAARASRYSSGDSRSGWTLVFVASWLVLPVVFTFVVSFARPLFLARYLLVCLPALVLLAGAGISLLRPRVLAVALMLAMLGFSVQGVRAYYRQDFDIAREDWRSATTHILGQAQPGDAILFHTAQGRMPFEFYEGLANAPVRPDIVFPASGPRLTFRDFFGRPSLSLAEDLAPQRQRVWLVLSHHLGPSGPDQLSAALSTALAAHYSHSERSEFPGIEVWQFSR